MLSCFFIQLHSLASFSLYRDDFINLWVLSSGGHSGNHGNPYRAIPRVESKATYAVSNDRCFAACKSTLARSGRVHTRIESRAIYRLSRYVHRIEPQYFSRCETRVLRSRGIGRCPLSRCSPYLHRVVQMNYRSYFRFHALNSARALWLIRHAFNRHTTSARCM